MLKKDVKVNFNAIWAHFWSLGIKARKYERLCNATVMRIHPALDVLTRAGPSPFRTSSSCSIPL